MRLLVCGPREWDKPAMVSIILDGFEYQYSGSLVIIEGGCPTGVDDIVADWNEYNQEHRTGRNLHLRFEPDWGKYGAAAGPIRNQEMLKEGQPDLVIGFGRGVALTPGTANMIQQATEAGVPTWVVSKYEKQL